MVQVSPHSCVQALTGCRREEQLRECGSTDPSRAQAPWQPEAVCSCVDTRGRRMCITQPSLLSLSCRCAREALGCVACREGECPTSALQHTGLKCHCCGAGLTNPKCSPHGCLEGTESAQQGLCSSQLRKGKNNPARKTL